MTQTIPLSKKTLNKKELEKILTILYDNEKLIQTILQDAFRKSNKFKPSIYQKIDDLFPHKMMEQVEPIDIKEGLKLLKIEYEALEKKCWENLFDKISSKLIYMWDIIIYDNIKILNNILKSNVRMIEKKLIEALETEKKTLENLINLHDKVSYEELVDATLDLLEEHLKLQLYAINRKLLPVEQ